MAVRARRRRAAKAARIRRVKSSPSTPGSAVPRTEIAGKKAQTAQACLGGAPRGARPSPRTLTPPKAWSVWKRLAALHPLVRGDEEDRPPRAATKNRGEDACLARNGQARRALRWLSH